MPEAAEELSAVKAVRSQMVTFPESVFLLGANLDHIDRRLRDLDLQKRLGICNVLDATPGRWVHLGQFSICSWMVTNGQYAEFTRFADESGGCFYDSGELWRHVWTELGCHIDRAQMPYKTPDGAMRYFDESYSACSSFIEAYLLSIHYEMQAVFLGIPEEARAAGGGADSVARVQTGSFGKMPRDRVLRRVMAFVKYKLRDAVGEGAALTDEEERLFNEYQSAQAALDDIELITKELQRGYGRQVDPRLKQRFERGQLIVEPVLLLTRLAEAVRADPSLEMPVPVSRVIYPRRWRSPEGEVKKKSLIGKIGKAVSWEDVPVTGISYFEALAYVVWLSAITDTALALPSEAEYERASSWPYSPPVQPGKPVKCDARGKLLFPWQDHSDKDFFYYFGRDGFDLEGYYHKDRARYQELLAETARKVHDHATIHQLEGFGWHWTADRYNESELKYSRFGDPEYRRFAGAPCFDGPESRCEVVDYEPNQNPRDTFIVLKGSPDVIGGPGLTTRRYAVYPLRGYSNVGFRVACRE
jgi:formylglycine-generating enzyme required for sulfatase activity